MSRKNSFQYITWYVWVVSSGDCRSVLEKPAVQCDDRGRCVRPPRDGRCHLSDAGITAHGPEPQHRLHDLQGRWCTTQIIISISSLCILNGTPAVVDLLTGFSLHHHIWPIIIIIIFPLIIIDRPQWQRHYQQSRLRRTTAQQVYMYVHGIKRGVRSDTTLTQGLWILWMQTQYQMAANPQTMQLTKSTNLAVSLLVGCYHPHAPSVHACNYYAAGSATASICW